MSRTGFAMRRSRTLHPRAGTLPAQITPQEDTMNAHEIRQTFSATPEVMEQGRQQFEAMIARSTTDREFRSRLVNDPRAAVKEFTGADMPEGMDIVFIENKATATVVLPDMVSDELSETELETAAGGVLPIIIASAIFCAFVAGATSND